MMYDVTRFDGGVPLTGVCHLTPDIFGGSVTTCPAQARAPPQRAFDEPVLPHHVGRGGGPHCTCVPSHGIVDEHPHSSEHLHPLPRPAHALPGGCPRFPIGARLSSQNLSQKHLCCPLSLWERARVRGPEAFRWDIKPLTPTLSQGRGSWKALCHKP